MPHATDLDLTPRDVAELASPDAIAGFFANLGYDTAKRTTLSPEAVGLSGETAGAVKRIETLSEDPEQFLRVVFAQPKSLTAKVRNDLVRVLGRGTLDHLLVLASDFDTLEFVFLDKRKRERRGPAASAGRLISQTAERIQVVPKTISVNRRSPTRLDLRLLRRFTWTCRDALDQFDKLRAVFDAAAYTGEYFQNRGLFSDHYLRERLRDDAAWRESPAELFAYVRDLLRDAQGRWGTKNEATLRAELLEPLFARLGFEPVAHRPPKTDQPQPDYLLNADGKALTAAFVYAWDRWLDGPDLNDADTPDENPGACVVSALESGIADWIIVTNGRLWRLYSRQAHARATNFYEVDLVEALTDSGDTDPNEAFRYWSLFFRPAAFMPCGVGVPPAPSAAGTAASQADAAGAAAPQACWLDAILFGSRDYAKRLGERLKERVFVSIFPHLAQGFLHDRRQRLGHKAEPTEQELADVFEATLTLLYRLLFLLYAESRDLLPIREAPYYAASLKKIKEEIADRGGVAETDLDSRLQKAYSPSETAIYDRLSRLFRAMDQGDPVLNVPTYNGGLFQAPVAQPPSATVAQPAQPGAAGPHAETREQHIARFLLEHKVPDRFLAVAIDRLARDQDERTLGLVFIDYKSLEVRHLGSIYEGLLEFQLKVADDDLTTQTDKKGEKYIPLKASGTRERAGNSTRRRKAVEKPIVVAAGEVYLSNDKAQRKASGSYYTPDPIVKYIVEQAVGPVLAERLESLRGEFRQVRKTFDRELQKARAFPGQTPAAAESPSPPDPRELAAENTYAACRGLVERLFEFRVLDPAMGSGHFLVEAVDFITDRLLTFLNQFPVNPVTFMLARMRRNILQALAEQGISIDPIKLTDVNLLKRHVLKRCIYGVDLNPMAVELAKLSLWLDAFTLGAPLSFLDHHLRCGNSLIGATFADLRAATRGKLFGIDYEPLLRAIRHVLHVNKMADATAAEVKQSASEYDHARRELSGYQIVLDLLVARHFGFPMAPGLLEHGDDLKLDSRTDFMNSLDDLGELALVERVESLARQPDRRFFHWEIEFPEVFFAFSDVQQRHLKHKNDLAEGSAGFDAVVGNPPYVRQETIKPFKDFLKTSYETFDSTNDLYVYFQEQEIRHLRAGGRMGMIVANKWMRAGYGERLRGYLMRTACPQEVVDFGHSPIFPDADTFPCILIVSRRAVPASIDAPADGEAMVTCQVPRENWNDRMDLGTFVSRGRYAIPTRLLQREGWSLENPGVQALLEKIRLTGVPLKDYCGSSPLYGIKTGFNDAFFIDEPTRARLIAEDKKSAEVIKPLLRGRDIDRWRPRRSGTYLIFARRGIEIDRYPAIKRHLAQYRQQLEPRPADWSGPTTDWPGRAPGDYKWYELQASPGDELVNSLGARKLLYQVIQFHSWFCLECDGAAINDKAFMLPSDDLALLGTLCSPLMWWQLTRVLPHMKDEAINPAGFIMQDIRVCVGDEPITSLVRELVAQQLAFADRMQEFEAELFARVGRFLETDATDRRVLTWLALPSETFVTRLAKLAELRRPSAVWQSEASAFHREARSRQVELLVRHLELEKRLASLVEDAYGLTAAERALLRSTRPIRDPVDVLEAKIRGTGVLASLHETDAE